jgi:hypothetical protein
LNNLKAGQTNKSDEKSDSEFKVHVDGVFGNTREERDLLIT